MMKSSASNTSTMYYILALLLCIITIEPIMGEVYNHRPLRDEYDYVVVGSGAAGSVVASRLAADPRQFTVLLIEAGGPSQVSVGGTQYAAARYDVVNGQYVPGPHLTVYDVPSFNKITWGNGQAPDADGDWNVPSNLAVYIAKVVGGCMVHNGLAWARAIKPNIDAWNVTGWSFEDLLTYYKKSENNTSPRAANNPAVHGYDGPITISDPAIIDTEATVMYNSCLNAGFPNMPDNAAQNDGCGYLFVNADRGVRDSSANAYLAPLLNNRTQNIDMVMFAQATEVIFNHQSSNPKAIGVKYTNLRKGTHHEIKARKEVLLAAGTLLSPHLLYFSGIGPEDVLKQYNISVRVNNTNVGRHIRNQLRLNLSYNSPNTTNPNLNMLGAQALQYAKDGTGYFAQANGAFNAYVRTNASLPNADINLSILPAGGVLDKTQQMGIIINTPVYSDGYIVLQSGNPLDVPYHAQPALTHQQDIDTFVAGIKTLRRIVDSQPAASFFGQELSPGRAVSTDAQLEAFVTKNGTVATLHHFAGSCRMGNPGDPLAVVDPRLRVYGVQNLRVVDASINPGSVRHLLQATVIAVAEKAAAMILEDANNL